MYYITRTFGTLALAALGVAVWFSSVLARADSYFRAATFEAVGRAVEIAPRNADYLALRALQLDYADADATALRERIASLNPLSSAPRIKLGLAAELGGDSASAERWLLEAASIDHQFEPRWTLANFYFRAGRSEDFWKWMRAALEVSYGDRTPAFDLCWHVSASGDEILRRAIPDRPDILRVYLDYLSQTNRVAALPAAARKLGAFHDPSDRPLLLAACDRLLAAGDPSALEVWSLAGEPAPQGIFNGGFARAPLGHGFDWRPIASPGVTGLHLDAPPAFRISLNGSQPESCALLAETLHLTAKRYRLQWDSRTAGIKSPSGLEWRIAGQRAILPPSEDWATGELTFTVPAIFSLLELDYQRPLGESRAEGSVELRNIRLLEADAP